MRGGRRKYRDLLLRGRGGERRSGEGKKREEGKGKEGRERRGGKETGPTFSLVHATPLTQLLFYCKFSTSFVLIPYRIT